jgi:hypothetical protein
MRPPVAASAVLLLLVAAAPARAQSPTVTPAMPPAPETAAPETAPPRANPVVPPTVPPAPVTAAPSPPPPPRWARPLTIALEVGAVGFAVASIAVLSSGPTSDATRVNVAAGLGAGTVACAAAGVIIGFVVH